MKDRLLNSGFIRICLVSLLLQMGNQLIMTVLPLYLDTLGYAPALLGTATALCSLTAMCARPVSGAIADRVSKRLVMCAGLLLMLAGMLGLAVLPCAAALLILRAMQGGGFSAASTSQTAIAADVLPESRIKSGLSYFAVVTTVAGALGSAMGLRLIVGANYTPAWLGGAALFGVGAALSLTFTQKGGRVRAHADAPAADARGLWRYFERAAIFPALLQLVLMVAASSIAFLPSFGSELGVDIGLFYTLQACAALLANLATGRYIDRVRNPRWLLLPGALCCAVAFAALFFARDNALFLASAVLYGLGNGVCLVVVSAVCMASAPAARRGAASATFQCAGDVGYCVGSLLWGLIAGGTGYRAMYGVAVALPVLAAAMSLLGFRARASAAKQG